VNVYISISIQSNVSVHIEDYINEVLDENNDEDVRKNQSEDWEGGLTFIAKSSNGKTLMQSTYIL
jgi:solute carrier family 9 (sodium/hydrogen exchanger), member 3